MHVCVLNYFGHVQFLVTLWTVAHQVPLSMGFSRQGYWSRLPCPPPEGLPNPGIKPMFLLSPALACGLFTLLYLRSSLILISSVQFSHSVVSDSLWPHESQHARPLCPSPTPGVHSKSCPLSPRCHLAISSSIVPFFSCPQSLPASGSFPMSQCFTWGGQSIGVSASASALPMNTRTNLL